MEIGENMTSKQNASSAINRARAKVRVIQKVPDTEKTDEGDRNAFCSGVNTH